MYSCLANAIKIGLVVLLNPALRQPDEQTKHPKHLLHLGVLGLFFTHLNLAT